jgi:hypothetical protein
MARKKNRWHVRDGLTASRRKALLLRPYPEDSFIVHVSTQRPTASSSASCSLLSLCLVVPCSLHCPQPGPQNDNRLPVPASRNTSTCQSFAVAVVSRTRPPAGSPSGHQRPPKVGEAYPPPSQPLDDGP